MPALNYPYGNNVSNANANTTAMNYYPQQPATIVFVLVDSENEARNAYVAPGATGYFMERKNSRFHVKSCTINGEIATFKTFDFTEYIPPQPTTESATAQYVTIDSFNKSIDELKALINSKVSTRKNNPAKEKTVNG